MDYQILLKEDNERVKERFDLACMRVKELSAPDSMPALTPEMQSYVSQTALFMCRVIQQAEALEAQNAAENAGTQNAARDAGGQNAACYTEERSHLLYQDVLGEAYEKSFVNPACAVEKLGSPLGLYLSALAYEVRGMVRYAFESRYTELTVCMELFLEVVFILEDGCKDKLEMKSLSRNVKQAIYYYLSDYAELFVGQRTRAFLDPEYSMLRDIVMEQDLSNTDYLYRYGDYISKDARDLSAFLASLPQETIDGMADTLVDGYYKGFEISAVPCKELVEIHYPFGLERVVKRCMERFEADGHKIVCQRQPVSLLNRRGDARIGCCDFSENPQMDYDHRNDLALFLDGDLKERKLTALRNTYEAYADQAAKVAGPAVLETFGEALFEPVNKPCVPKFSDKQQKMYASMLTEQVRITYEYINGEERCFSIISFPTPSISPDFEAIFNETIKVNTLDYNKFDRIQSVMIDALNQCTHAHIVGKGDNQTNLTVQLWSLKEPDKETLFENCLADMNIPVGEVFTSPKLKGTVGRLHVSKVYIDGMGYDNLFFDVKDGMVVDYGCKNFPEEDAGRELVKDKILFGNDSLPMGEFAIGTNTVAYKMAKTYNIFDKLQILIAEKTGPHIAFGDTCYSNSEDRKVFNPDGKECIARDNEISILRKTEPEKAYFGCHTDITLPYDELGSLCGVKADGTEIPIILNGRFVLPGTEELNEMME